MSTEARAAVRWSMRGMEPWECRNYLIGMRDFIIKREWDLIRAEVRRSILDAIGAELRALGVLA